MEPLMNNHITTFTLKSNLYTWHATSFTHNSFWKFIFSIILQVASPDFHAGMESFSHTHTHTHDLSSSQLSNYNFWGLFLLLFTGYFLWKNELFNTKSPKMVADEWSHWRRILFKKTKEKWEQAGHKSWRLREVCLILCGKSQGQIVLKTTNDISVSLSWVNTTFLQLDLNGRSDPMWRCSFGSGLGSLGTWIASSPMFPQ